MFKLACINRDGNSKVAQATKHTLTLSTHPHSLALTTMQESKWITLKKRANGYLKRDIFLG
jgi:hypothetical protein